MVSLRETLGCLKCKLCLHCSKYPDMPENSATSQCTETVRAWVTEVCVMVPISDSFNNLSC